MKHLAYEKDQCKISCKHINFNFQSLNLYISKYRIFIPIPHKQTKRHNINIFDLYENHNLKNSNTNILLMEAQNPRPLSLTLKFQFGWVIPLNTLHIILAVTLCSFKINTRLTENPLVGVNFRFTISHPYQM